MPIDYEVEYNNRARVPEHAEIFARWQREAADYRAKANAEEGCALGMSYGKSPRQIVDLFFPESSGTTPLAMFVHGGYWRSLEPAMFSHMAHGLNAHGVAVARRRLRSLPAGQHHRYHHADPSRLPLSLVSLRPAHHGLRPFRRRTSRRLHGRDRLEGARPRRARRPRADGYSLSGVFDLDAARCMSP